MPGADGNLSQNLLAQLGDRPFARLAEIPVLERIQMLREGRIVRLAHGWCVANPDLAPLPVVVNSHFWKFVDYVAKSFEADTYVLGPIESLRIRFERAPPSKVSILFPLNKRRVLRVGNSVLSFGWHDFRSSPITRIMLHGVFIMPVDTAMGMLSLPVMRQNRDLLRSVLEQYPDLLESCVGLQADFLGILKNTALRPSTPLAAPGSKGIKKAAITLPKQPVAAPRPPRVLDLQALPLPGPRRKLSLHRLCDLTGPVDRPATEIDWSDIWLYWSDWINDLNQGIHLYTSRVDFDTRVSGWLEDSGARANRSVKFGMNPEADLFTPSPLAEQLLDPSLATADMQAAAFICAIVPRLDSGLIGEKLGVLLGTLAAEHLTARGYNTPILRAECADLRWPRILAMRRQRTIRGTINAMAAWVRFYLANNQAAVGVPLQARVSKYSPAVRMAALRNDGNMASLRSSKTSKLSGV